MSNVIYEYKEETETLELNMEYKLFYSKKWRDSIWNTKNNSLKIITYDQMVSLYKISENFFRFWDLDLIICSSYIFILKYLHILIHYEYNS